MSVTDGWNPSLVSGVQDIDEQHRAIFEAIDKLLGALRHGYAEHEVENTLSKLEEYAKDHCRHEEDLMREHAYPEMEAHVESHVNFKARLADLRKTMQESGGSKALAVQTLQAIGKILMQDIEVFDRKLAGFLKDKGKT